MTTGKILGMSTRGNPEDTSRGTPRDPRVNFRGGGGGVSKRIPGGSPFEISRGILRGIPEEVLQLIAKATM